MNSVESKVSKRKVCVLICYIALALIFAWHFQPKYHNNSNALTVLVTVFSILAGFLVAVMAIVANDRALRGRNWRQNTFYLRRIRRELRLHSLLFYLYLVVLALSFLTELGLGLPAVIQKSMELLLLFLACLAMLFSFMLPKHLTKRHIDDLEHVIREQQDKEYAEQLDKTGR